MTFNWLDFLDLGDSLLASGKGPPIDESKLRTAISRMYYAVFGATRNHYTVVEKVRFFNHPDDHGILRDEIRKKKGSGVEIIFQRLRSKRNSADYDDPFPGNIQKNAEKQLRDAREVLFKHSLLAP